MNFFKTHKLENWQVLNRRYVNRRTLKGDTVKYHLWKNNKKYTSLFYFRFHGRLVKYVEAGVPGI